MQIAQLGHYLLSRPQHQVISVGENDLRAAGGYMIGQDSFDRSLRPDWHEGGCIEWAMGCGHASSARSAVFVAGQDFEAERHYGIIVRPAPLRIAPAPGRC